MKRQENDEGPISNYRFYESLDPIVFKRAQETKRLNVCDHSGRLRLFPLLTIEVRVFSIANHNPYIMNLRDCVFQRLNLIEIKKRR